MDPAGRFETPRRAASWKRFRSIHQEIRDRGDERVGKFNAAMKNAFSNHQPVGPMPALTPPQELFVPFANDAAHIWEPALIATRDFARDLGYQDLISEGTGTKVRGFSKEPINPIEMQRLILIRNGQRHTIGEILSEGLHLRNLKS